RGRAQRRDTRAHLVRAYHVGRGRSRRDRADGRRRLLASIADGGLGFGTLVPRLGTARSPHRPLVSLAREKHGVARLRDLDRSPDRRPAVDDDLVIATGSLARRARLDIAGDLDRIFGERVV